MTLLDPSDVKHAGVATNWDDSIIQVLLNSAESEITARRGPLGGTVTEQHLGGLRMFWLSRPASGPSGISSIVENVAGSLTTLATDDWLLHPNLMTLIRLSTGTHRADRWCGEVLTTFTPRDDTDERKRVQLQLVKQDMAWSGYSSESVSTGAGGQSWAANPNYQIERAGILASFALTVERH
jgi:hypothetical protein